MLGDFKGPGSGSAGALFNLKYRSMIILKRILGWTGAITHIMLSAPFFIIITFVCGLDKANAFMDNIATAWIELGGDNV